MWRKQEFYALKEMTKIISAFAPCPNMEVVTEILGVIVDGSAQGPNLWKKIIFFLGTYFLKGNTLF